MAATTRKLTATTPVGTFTRRTARTYSHVIVRHEVVTLEQAIESKRRAISACASYLESAIAYVERNGIESTVYCNVNDYQERLDEARAVEPIAKESYRAVSWAGRPELVAGRLKAYSNSTAYPVDA